MTDTRREYEALAGLYVPIMAAVVVIVFAAVLFAAVRFRDREGHEREPRRFTEAPKLEALYVLGLLGVAAVLLWATFRTEDRVTAVNPRPGLEVGVVASKWNWRFDYPGGVSQVGTPDRPATLVVPEGTTVRFRLISLDVVHSMWVPDLKFKRDAYPGTANVFDLAFRAGGRGRGHCTEFCGLQHSYMSFAVETMSRPDFDRWIGERRRIARAPREERG